MYSTDGLSDVLYQVCTVEDYHTVLLGKIKSSGGGLDFKNSSLTAQKAVKKSENITT